MKMRTQDLKSNPNKRIGDFLLITLFLLMCIGMVCLFSGCSDNKEPDSEGQFSQEEEGQKDDLEEPVIAVETMVDYIQAQKPSDLELEGDSMKEYEIYPLEGQSEIDGLPCRQFHVYKVDEDTGTNEIVGEYLFSENRRTIYKIDSETGDVKKLL
ncbi:MAG: hypothetical protein HFE73_00610 [Firmicutes bacterium]|nr:hypothetical protein [Bacillota bacterium]